MYAAWNQAGRSAAICDAVQELLHTHLDYGALICGWEKCWHTAELGRWRSLRVRQGSLWLGFQAQAGGRQRKKRDWLDWESNDKMVIFFFSFSPNFSSGSWQRWAVCPWFPFWELWVPYSKFGCLHFRCLRVYQWVLLVSVCPCLSMGGFRHEPKKSDFLTISNIAEILFHCYQISQIFLRSLPDSCHIQSCAWTASHNCQIWKLDLAFWPASANPAKVCVCMSACMCVCALAP